MSTSRFTQTRKPEPRYHKPEHHLHQVSFLRGRPHRSRHFVLAEQFSRCKQQQLHRSCHLQLVEISHSAKEPLIGSVILTPRMSLNQNSNNFIGVVELSRATQERDTKAITSPLMLGFAHHSTHVLRDILEGSSYTYIPWERPFTRREISAARRALVGAKQPFWNNIALPLVVADIVRSTTDPSNPWRKSQTCCTKP